MQNEDQAPLTSEQLEKSFAPYPQFVEAVLKELTNLEAILVQNTKDAELKKQTDAKVEVAPVSAAPASTVNNDASWIAKISKFESEAKTMIQAVEVEWRSKLHSSEEEAQLRLRSVEEASLAKLNASEAEVTRLLTSVRNMEDEVARTKSELKLVRANLAAAEAQDDEEDSPAPSSPRKTTPRVSTPSVKLSEKKVLLVDDAEINRVLMSHYFKGLPIKLDFASNAHLASDKCREDSFDLVVVDFDDKGGELAQGLRTQGVRALLIALSPNSFSESEKEKAMSAGFDHYLSRGLPREDLVASLRSRLWP